MRRERREGKCDTGGRVGKSSARDGHQLAMETMQALVL